MLDNKAQIQKDMKDVEKYLTMYKTAFPENPAFT